VALRKKKAVAFFSLEMSKEQLVQRLLCSEASVDSQRVRNGDMRPEDWLSLTKAANSLTESNIFIDETANITVMDLRAKARRLKSNHQIALVVIDYLQLMQGSGGSRNENRQQEITEISRSLKALAKELKIPVMALSQLSRESERRKGNRPVLSDLRESGSLEQDADLVAFLHRPDRYKEDADDEPLSDAAEVQFIIAKNRNGPVGTLPLLFESSFTRFRSMAKRAD
jgi:replicative DNA helicase